MLENVFRCYKSSVCGRVSLLSGIAIAYLKTIKYFKIFAHAHTRKERKKEKRFGKIAFFVCLVCARGQIFLVL